MMCWQGGSVKYEINTLSHTSMLALSSSVARPYCHSAPGQNGPFPSLNLYISSIMCRGSLSVGIKILSNSLILRSNNSLFQIFWNILILAAEHRRSRPLLFSSQRAYLRYTCHCVPSCNGWSQHTLNMVTLLLSLPIPYRSRYLQSPL